ncbi:MAG: response regulator [Proteobacteria bacterium]|nr:response regulator [Pseudomonadota bacterium]MBU4470524.1 response regulator [Pseudomonadota bacterium]MCG2751360.1 response regulator [Desulfobacteraceae bacterium]
MEKTIQWLKKIEALAGLFYLKASEYFAHDEAFSRFLKNLSDEENEHFNLIEKIGSRLQGSDSPSFTISMDSKMVYEVEHDFAEILKDMADGDLTKEMLIKKIIDLEFSEWNDFFLYVMAFFKKNGATIQFPLEKFQNHKRAIEEYCDQYPELKEKLQHLKNRPSIWTEKILVVDDEEVVSDLLQMVLQDKGHVDVALNGEDGMNKLKAKYYKLIISDMDMPVMDGMTFYRAAKRLFPNIDKRFLFFTGNLTNDKMDFIKENHLAYMEKPASLNEIKKNAAEILTRA